MKCTDYCSLPSFSYFHVTKESNVLKWDVTVSKVSYVFFNSKSLWVELQCSSLPGDWHYRMLRVSVSEYSIFLRHSKYIHSLLSNSADNSILLILVLCICVQIDTTWCPNNRCPNQTNNLFDTAQGNILLKETTYILPTVWKGVLFLMFRVHWWICCKAMA